MKNVGPNYEEKGTRIERREGAVCLIDEEGIIKEVCFPTGDRSYILEKKLYVATPKPADSDAENLDAADSDAECTNGRNPENDLICIFEGDGKGNKTSTEPVKVCLARHSHLVNELVNILIAQNSSNKKKI